MSDARSTDPLLNAPAGAPNGHRSSRQISKTPLQKELDKMNQALGHATGAENMWLREFFGDPLLAERRHAKTTLRQDFRHVIRNPAFWGLLWLYIKNFGRGVSIKDGAGIIAGVSEYGPIRKAVLQGFSLFGRTFRGQVEAKWAAMLHPPLSYLGDAFQHRSVDGTFNSVLHPHLGQAGAPYAKTVPAKARLLGAQPDPGDIFDRLMAREDKPRISQSGLSVLLIYHATIIIHDVFRTSAKDKNISDSSSYLDLSPLYGFDEETMRQVRTGCMGLLKPDTFAENRLLRQPPGVCTMLVMYNRYHNYCARQLFRINENERFRVPEQYAEDEKTALEHYQSYYFEQKDYDVRYRRSTRECEKEQDTEKFKEKLAQDRADQLDAWKKEEYLLWSLKKIEEEFSQQLMDAKGDLTQIKSIKEERSAKMTALKDRLGKQDKNLWGEVLNVRDMDEFKERFKAARKAAWAKLDDDLFGTARLITCGLYVNISVHDYLRALMGFHQFNTTFTLDPRLEVDKKDGKEGLPRGIGNQVSVEFNLLYRFHCAIGKEDEEWTNNFIRQNYGPLLVELKEARDKEGNLITSIGDLGKWDPATLTSSQFTTASKLLTAKMAADPTLPKLPDKTCFFGMDNKLLERDEITGQYDDQTLIDILTTKMDQPIGNFGPKNTPRALKAVEVAGILQARKWEVGTLNDFREFFGMKRHNSFEDISRDPEVCQALSDLYENVDKVEFYPGVFCEGGSKANPRDLDPGPQIIDSTLWSAIFSDAVTLVRSDRFYTVDWNTNSLTSWGMKEVTPDSDTLKSSVFHRLLARAFPDWWGSNNLHFFHPFYTTEQNMKYAVEQGYGPLFGLKPVNTKKQEQVDKIMPQVKEAARPKKPNDTMVLCKDLKRTDNMTGNVTIVVKDLNSAKQVLGTKLQNFSNPAWVDDWATPPAVTKALSVRKTWDPKEEHIDILADPAVRVGVCQYFRYLTKVIVERESNVFVRGKTPEGSTYQIDAVRDLAIPVLTRYFVDFLGFRHLLIDMHNKKGKYSENEIYNHIANVQTFLAYNVDETKQLRRRKDFKNSLELLLSMTKDHGHIRQARSWLPSWLSGATKYQKGEDSDFVGVLGYEAAQKLLKDKTIKDDGVAAAVLLLIALDAAFNAVLAFTTTLSFLFAETSRSYEFKTVTQSVQEARRKLRQKLNDEHNLRTKRAPHLGALSEEEIKNLGINPGLVSWKDLQTIALDSEKSEVERDELLMHYVLEAQRLKVKLPLVRKVTEDEFKLDTSDFVFRKGDTVIVDVHQCESQSNKLCDNAFCGESMNLKRNLNTYLAYSYGFGHDAVSSELKYIPIVGLGSIFSLMASMRYLRQGHDTQGRLKEINNNPSYRNLYDYCSSEDARAYTKEYKKRARPGESFDTKPNSTTYMTPEWDETIPFPNTLKVRFEGFGEGVWTYGDNSDQSHGIMSLYEPQGPSHTGGTWALSSAWKKQEAAFHKQLAKEEEEIHRQLDAHERLFKSLGAPYNGCGM